MKRELDPDVRLLQALADPVRLSIVRQLGETEAVCACDFDACGTVSQPTVSHHLRILREAGIVRGERRGTWIWYALEPEALARARGILEGLRPGPAGPLATAGSRTASSGAAGGPVPG